jgi:hypothetical protein
MNSIGVSHEVRSSQGKLNRKVRQAVEGCRVLSVRSGGAVAYAMPVVHSQQHGMAQSAYSPLPLEMAACAISIALRDISPDILRAAMAPDGSAVRVQLGMV